VGQGVKYGWVWGFLPVAGGMGCQVVKKCVDTGILVIAGGADERDALRRNESAYVQTFRDVCDAHYMRTY
jgi:hypothetical protein